MIDAKIVGNKGFEIKNLDFKFHLPSSKLAEIKEQATSAKLDKTSSSKTLKIKSNVL